MSQTRETLLKYRWWICLPTLITDIMFFISFILTPTLPSTQPTVNFYSEFSYWPVTFGIAIIGLFWALYKNAKIELALFISGGVSAGLFSQLLVGFIFAGATGVGPTGSLASALSAIMTGILFAKSRDIHDE